MNKKYLKNYINGEYVEPLSGSFTDVINPSKGKNLFSESYAQSLKLSSESDYEKRYLPNSTDVDIDLAVNAAEKTFLSWKQTNIEKRAQILNKIADLIDKNLEKLAWIESQDQGKPFWLTKKVDIPRAAYNFRYFAGHMQHRMETSSHLGNNYFNYTSRFPLGVVGLISPWNLPLYLLTWKIAPAIMSGNTVVCKPSEVTSQSAYFLSELFAEAGLPKGVCNIVFGDGRSAGNSLVAHQDVKAISFTGGTDTGRKINESVASSFKKVSLEMGGKNSNIVFSSADIDLAVETSISSSFLNQGEICLCGSRIFVHKSIYTEFKNKFIKKVKALKVGPPSLEENFLGAVVSKDHYEKIKNYIDLGLKQVGQMIAGDEALELDKEYADGFYIRPTVFENLAVDSSLHQEEIFGPVVCLNSFDTEDEVVEWANNTKYGLSASVWTNDLNQAHRLIAMLDVGTVWVNTWMKRDLRMPFGGVKHSGLGREGADYSIDFFTEVKNACINLGKN